MAWRRGFASSPGSQTAASRSRGTAHDTWRPAASRQPPSDSSSSAAPTPSTAARVRTRVCPRLTAASRASIDANLRLRSSDIPRMTTFRSQAGAPDRREGCDASASAPDGPVDARRCDEQRPAAVQRLVQRDAEAELIGARVERLAAELLGRHVRRRADERAGLGHGRRRRDGASTALPTSGGSDRLLREPREPEVHDAHGAVAPDHDVLGLEVAVDDAGRVRRRQPAPGGDEHVQDLAPASRLRAQPRVDGLAFDELHRDVDAIVDGARVVDGDDVRVRQARDRARLAQQARPALGRVRRRIR